MPRKSQHRGDTKADMQSSGCIEKATFYQENSVVAHLGKILQSIPQIEIISHLSSLSRYNPSSSLIEDSPKKSRRVLFAPYRYQSGSPHCCARLAATFRVDLRLTDNLLDGTLDVGRVTMGRKTLVFAFARRRIKTRQIMGERQTYSSMFHEVCSPSLRALDPDW